jgi:hypothetical protein
LENSGRQNYEKLFHISTNILALNGKIKLLFTNILLFICCFTIYIHIYMLFYYRDITMWFTINIVVKRFLKKIKSEITLKYFRLLPLLNMEFP